MIQYSKTTITQQKVENYPHRFKIPIFISRQKFWRRNLKNRFPEWVFNQIWLIVEEHEHIYISEMKFIFPSISFRANAAFHHHKILIYAYWHENDETGHIFLSLSLGVIYANLACCIIHVHSALITASHDKRGLFNVRHAK